MRIEEKEEADFLEKATSEVIEKLQAVYDIRVNIVCGYTNLHASLTNLNKGLIVAVMIPYEVITLDENTVENIYHTLRTHLENEWIAAIKR